MKGHIDIDWEEITETLAWKFSDLKYNIYPYYETKSICEEEVMYYMEHEEDTMSLVKSRIRYRIKNRIEFFRFDEDRLFHENFDYLESAYNNNNRKFYQINLHIN